MIILFILRKAGCIDAKERYLFLPFNIHTICSADKKKHAICSADKKNTPFEVVNVFLSYRL